MKNKKFTLTVLSFQRAKKAGKEKADHVVGRNSDHRHPCRHAAARSEQGTGESQSSTMHQ